MGIIDIDGDEFAECDYGLLVDNSSGTQKLASSLEQLAQAALQAGTITFGTITKLYNSSSMAEKQRIIENSEREVQQRQQQMQEQQLQSQQQIAQMQSQDKQAELQLKDLLNQRDNETQILLKTLELQDTEGDGIIEDPNRKQELEAKGFKGVFLLAYRNEG
jgi:DNA anti-recombination protein RmuC